MEDSAPIEEELREAQRQAAEELASCEAGLAIQNQWSSWTRATTSSESS